MSPPTYSANAATSPSGTVPQCRGPLGAELGELLTSLFGFRRIPVFADELLQHQASVDLVAELGEGSRLSQQRGRHLVALRITQQHFVEFEDRPIVVAGRVVGLADIVLSIVREIALRRLAKELAQLLDRTG